MLDKHYQMTEEKLKLQSMENRVRRLEFEDNRAQKLEEKATKKAQNMIEARKRHFEDMLMKKNHYLNLQLQESKQRQLNERKRQEAKNTIHQRRVEAYTQNLNTKEETLQAVIEAKIRGQKYEMELLEKQKEQKLRDLLQKN